MIGPNRRRPRLALTAAAAMGAALLLAGCGSGSDAGGQFVTGDEAAYPVRCMEHQSEKPGSDYTAGENGSTLLVLNMLRYYTANRAVSAYCDGKPPTKTDRAWAQLYVDLGAEPGNVGRILS